MAMSKRRLTASLEKLALSDLRRRFEQETGETNRTPNRAFLIRRIVEAVEVARRATESEAEAALPAVETRDGARQELARGEQELESTSATDVAAPLREPVPGSVRVEQVDGTATVLEDDTASLPSDPGSTDQGSVATASAQRMPRGALTGLSVEQLQTKYVEVVGRPTGSSDKAYLVWKIREALKGKVPRGPREPKRRDAQAQDVMVLPLRLPARTVNAMDHVWHTLGIRTRTDFLRDAIRLHLERLNAPDVAAHFARA